MNFTAQVERAYFSAADQIGLRPVHDELSLQTGMRYLDDNAVLNVCDPDTPNEVLVGALDRKGFERIHRAIIFVFDEVLERVFGRQIDENTLLANVNRMYKLHEQELAAMELFNPRKTRIGIGAGYTAQGDALLPSFYPITRGDYTAPKLGFASVLAYPECVHRSSVNRLAELGYSDLQDVGGRIEAYNGAQPSSRQLLFPLSLRAS